MRWIAVGLVGVLLVGFLGVLSRPPEASALGWGGGLASGSVPAAFVPWVERAGQLCPAVPAPLLAAQLEQESGFNPNAVSSAGAQGIAQFMPGTFASVGRDEDGNGTASPFDPGDAIMAQGRYMCSLADQMAKGLAAGTLHGDLQALTLAAYNAGPGAVLKAGGVPSFPETQAYVPKILGNVVRFGGVLGGGGTAAVGVPANAGAYGPVIAALTAKLGTPYNYGGGTVSAPTVGLDPPPAGWDCSSFMQYGFYQGTGGRVLLPRTSKEQARAYYNPAISVTDPPVGALLWFYNGSPFLTHHVAIYIGGGQMIEEPGRGRAARIVPFVNGRALNGHTWVPATGAGMVPIP